MVSIKEEVAGMKKDIEYIRKSVDETRVTQKLIFTKLDGLNKEFDKKYASKLTEKIVYALVGMILVAVFTKILNVW